MYVQCNIPVTTVKKYINVEHPMNTTFSKTSNHCEILSINKTKLRVNIMVNTEQYGIDMLNK